MILQKGQILDLKVIGLIKDEFGEKNYEKSCWTKSKNLQLLNR